MTLLAKCTPSTSQPSSFAASRTMALDQTPTSGLVTQRVPILQASSYPTRKDRELIIFVFIASVVSAESIALFSISLSPALSCSLPDVSLYCDVQVINGSSEASNGDKSLAGSRVE